MLRVVLDTNAVISGLLWGGPPRQLLDLAHRNQIRLFTSLALLSELDAVLRRRKFASRLKIAGVAPSNLVIGYAALAFVIHSPPPIPRLCRDPSDDDVLACGKSAQADLIVSGDNDLLSLKKYTGIPITNAADSLALIRARTP